MPASVLSSDVMTSSINKAIFGLQRRAENVEAATLVSTFVDSGLTFSMLSTIDHQILYGRRGTGKTHVLRYLLESQKNLGDICIYIDLRTIGSNGSIYSDNTIPILERATRLALDTITFLYNLGLTQ